MKRTLITIFGTLAAAAVIAIGGAYAFILSGIYDVSATKPDSRLFYWVTHQTMEHSVARRLAANMVPAGLDAPAQIAAGGALYVANCAVCHGGPGLAPTAISKGLNPQPPDLFRATREPDAAENFQFIKHGVKMTGMPGFAPTKSDGRDLVAGCLPERGAGHQGRRFRQIDSESDRLDRTFGASFGRIEVTDSTMRAHALQQHKGNTMTYQSLNPATGKLLKTFDELTDDQLEKKLAAAAKCFETWKHKSYAERAVIVAKAAALVHERVEDAGPHHDAGDGQAHRRGARRGGVQLQDPRLLRQECRALPCE